jgi:uncharacterized protein YdcH (DUF465 family)
MVRRTQQETHRVSHTPHELAAEFPEKAALISRLKQSDAHFARLAERYHVVNREIHRIDSQVAPASDETTEELKKERLHLLDEIVALMDKAA